MSMINRLGKHSSRPWPTREPRGTKRKMKLISRLKQLSVGLDVGSEFHEAREHSTEMMRILKEFKRQKRWTEGDRNVWNPKAKASLIFV